MYLCIFFRPLSTISRYSGRAHGDGGQEVAKYIARGKTLCGEKPARSLCPLVQLVQAGKLGLIEAKDQVSARWREPSSKTIVISGFAFPALQTSSLRNISHW